MVKKQTVFSGIKPSGAIHLGNYLGAITQWLELQENNHCIFCIVDYHAITVAYDPKIMRERIFDAALDYLAAGLDPNKSIIFLQSDVPEHTELAWLLETITPVGELERMTQYKDKSKTQKSVQAGLLNYPVLMAADILLYQTDVVPVGEDQQQHVELTRIIARKFNNAFGPTFVMPKAQLTETRRIMSLTDPTKKMGKEFGQKHSVILTDTPDVIRQKIKSAVTDVGANENEMSPGVKNLILLLHEFGTAMEYKKYETAYNNKTIRYSELKETLAEAVVNKLQPFQKKRAELAQDPKAVWKTLADGAKKARPIARYTLAEVKRKMGLL